MIGNFWSLTPSQVYRELAAIADAGLIRAGKRGPRDRQPYSLTHVGKAAFRRWIDQEPGPEHVRFPVLLTIGIGRDLDADRVAEIVHHHRAAHAHKLAEYQELRLAPSNQATTRSTRWPPSSS